MKYTRYDLKKKNDNKIFIVLVLFILILAFLFGTIIFKFSVGNHNSRSTLKAVKNTVNSEEENKNSKTIKFIVIQGGIYENKENIETEKNLLNTYGTPFTINEGNKTRTLLGIYTEEQGGKIIKLLNDQKVDNSKMMFTLNKNDMCDVEIIELINANIQIINKLSEKNVKGIQTDELKKWCLSLKKVNKESKNIAILNNFKDYVNKMPKEISKEKGAENYIYLYEVLKKVGSKNN